MNYLRFYTTIYGWTVTPKGFPVWWLAPIRRLIRLRASKRLPAFFAKVPISFDKKREEGLIVSLTSFPARIDYVYQTIESILRQTILPEKIILWLSLKQFPNKTGVPERLSCLQNDIFEIRFVEDDIRSHKKYYYTFQLYPKAKVVLLDDDIIYNDRMLEKMLQADRKHPKSVVSQYAQFLSYNEDGSLQNYKNWKSAYSACKSRDLFLGTGGGTLIKPYYLYEDVTDMSLFTKLTPIADDVWINAMIRLGKYEDTQLITKKVFLPILIKNNQSLYRSNVGQSQNDIQLKAVSDYYLGKIGKDPFAKIV